MDTQYWIDRWQENKTGFHQDEVNAYLKTHIKDLSIKPGNSIFVPLCGKSKDMLWLLQKGYKVIGNEVSTLAVESFFEENNISATISPQGDLVRYEHGDLCILCGDFFSLSVDDLDEANAIYDRASLVALPSELRQQYVDKIQSLFPDQIETLLISMEYPQGEIDGPPFCVDRQEVHRLYDPYYQVSLLCDRDVLEENARFKKRGLTQMREQVYRMI